MSGKGTLSITLSVLLLLIQSAAQAEIGFVYPPNKSWVKRSDYLILKLNNPEISGVRIQVNDLPGDMLEVGTPEYRRAFRDILILRPAWDKGRNRVLVEAFKGDARVEAASAEIFYAPGADPALIPPEYRPFLMHTPEQEKLCAPCHPMNPSLAMMTSGVAQENPCYGCHKGMLDARYVHGPTGTYSCVYCHSGKGLPKYGVPKRDAALCGECHAEKGEEFAKRKYLHGPVAAGMCEVCHDPHGSPNPLQLRQPVNELCLSCHEPVRKEPHVVRVVTGAGHPLAGYSDPSRPGSGRDLSCVSCHDPHGGDARYFYAGNVQSRLDLCQKCHQK